MDTVLWWCSKAQMQNLKAQLFTQLSPISKSVSRIGESVSRIIESVSQNVSKFLKGKGILGVQENYFLDFS